jgi:NAD(P)-dependent dehydrogenase (short-subunit alcohol dehydrogenase family)
MPKVILITGCSKGFGQLFALDLARAGHTVAATSRSLERMDDIQQKTAAEHLPIHFYELDVTRPETIIKTVSEVVRDLGRIDVLINNAGYGLFAFIEHATPEEIKAQFETNVFGLIRVTQEVLPIMRRQGSGHIINISSAAVGGVSPMMGYYAASKWAVEALSEAMHLELKRSGIRTSIIQPGPYFTAFGESAVHDPKTKVIESLQPSRKRLQDRFLKDPQEVSDLVLKVVNSKRPKLRYSSGFAAKMIFFMRKILPGEWFIKLEGLLLALNNR